MLTPKRQLGDLGEKIALDYLKSRNYHILDKNYRKPWGEIDIVAVPPAPRIRPASGLWRTGRRVNKNNQEIVFVEVKAGRKNQTNFVAPEENIHFFKQKRLIKAAQTYLLEKNYPAETNWQIDVIAVELNEKTRKADLRHIKNAVF